ncbi:alpha/beta hydrolase family protein [Pleionea litopenaei]|uniref:Alpha/beta fold hydrolase n=1 Tax=Pleionea litopenaei TaxID=3070815 RepID=A0AA51RUH0_9GAMM|nr:alpha/beta fold hydrolase [Pleionea sp. HL-JVS1]WMS87827.1 alpha/beta fold hydrolase [Pleionea sp. HL-JVS1]
MGIKSKLLFVGLVAAGAYFYLSDDREPPADTRFNDAYRLEDGSVVSISASTPERVRVRHIDSGEIQAYYHYGKPEFEVTNGFSNKAVVAKGHFTLNKEGQVTGAVINENGSLKNVERLALTHEELYFQNKDISLRGKLTLPEGKGPFPVVVLIHGSESYSAVDYYSLTYMLAANGIAGFKFDKRGTGLSEGEYTQHFPTLASDVRSAIEVLKHHSEIDPERINLAGFSQGGWIAPLVAKNTNVRSILVGFGTVVKLEREDRWGYVKRLEEHGFGPAEVAKADEFNELLRLLIEAPTDEAWNELFKLTQSYKMEAWFKSVSGSDSMLGQVVEQLLSAKADYIPNWAWKSYFEYRTKGSGDNFNGTYDPMKTMKSINTPSIWLMAGEDSSLPTPETVTLLDSLIQMEKPVSYKVYEGAEHGNIVFTKNENHEKEYIKYVDTYFTDIIEWFKKQNDL